MAKFRHRAKGRESRGAAYPPCAALRANLSGLVRYVIYVRLATCRPMGDCGGGEAESWFDAVLCPRHKVLSGSYVAKWGFFAPVEMIVAKLKNNSGNLVSQRLGGDGRSLNLIQYINQIALAS
jgi:hypothetical protein